MNSVLLVSHDFSLSGAPRVAQMISRSLVDAGMAVQVVGRRDGALRAEFEQMVPTQVEPFWLFRRRLRCRLGRPGSALAGVLDTIVALWVILRSRCRLVYINSTAASAYVRPARWLRRRVILHVHESAEVATKFLEQAGVTELTDRIVACSPCVYRDLLASGMTTDQVRLVESVPDVERIVPGDVLPTLGEPGIGERLVVGCVGTVEHRKGADMWGEIARRVHEQLPSVEFWWVGDGEPPANEDARVIFWGAQPNPHPFFEHFDVLALPTRDDLFPLVVLEAMMHRRPVVAFRVGGVPEQIGDTGMVIEPGDIEAFADALVDLLKDPELRRELGLAARWRARELYSVDRFSERLVAAIADD